MRRGSLVVVFNGEIYDHVEQRAELERLGHRFTSGSDTEVLLAAYRAWGVDAFRRMNGMWACAILDEERRRLVIARDRYGVKPLYWWQGPGGELALASEIKALLRHPRIAARPDLEACARLLHTGPQGWLARTPFVGIERFPAGHWAEISIDAPEPLEPRLFWPAPQVDERELDAPFSAAEADRYAEEYRSLLGDAVRVRMRMDVRFGTALSGGLDSSQIAMLVNKELRRRGVAEKQEVFSCVYRADADTADAAVEADHAALRRADESAFIATMARDLDVHSNVIQPHARDIPHEHEHMIWALDVPPTNTLMSSWHTYALVARRGVIVTLDGQGADEQLAGYGYYARSLLVHARTRDVVAQAAALSRNFRNSGGTIALGLLGHVSRRVLGQRGLEALTARLRRGSAVAQSPHRALRESFATQLRTLLLFADKSSMAWSIESRMPFMDWRLVEFLARLPLAYCIHDGWSKWLARYAMNDALPDSILWRRDKVGWEVPEEAWFGPDGPLHDWLDRQLAGSELALEAASLAGVQWQRASLDIRMRLLNLAVWSRLFFEEPGRPGRSLRRQRRLGTA